MYFDKILGDNEIIIPITTLFRDVNKRHYIWTVKTNEWSIITVLPKYIAKKMIDEDKVIIAKCKLLRTDERFGKKHYVYGFNGEVDREVYLAQMYLNGERKARIIGIEEKKHRCVKEFNTEYFRPSLYTGILDEANWALIHPIITKVTSDNIGRRVKVIPLFKVKQTVVCIMP